MKPYGIGKYRNRLLDGLAAEDLALLEPHLTPVSLGFRKSLEAPNKTITDVYFVESGIVSYVTAQHEKGEVALVGCEGVTGNAVLMGDARSPLSAHVQISGEAQRINAECLVEIRYSPNNNLI
jgi:hypothetical protein